LIERFPGARLAANDVTWHDGMVRCLKALPLDLTPEVPSKDPI